MKTMNDCIADSNKADLSLHALVDDIIRKPSTDPANVNIHISNNIAPDLWIHGNEEVVASVIDGMIKAMITHAADGDIDISAKELFGKSIKLSVRDNNCYNTYAVACSLQNMVPVTERIGGFLDINEQRPNKKTNVFKFS